MTKEDKDLLIRDIFARLSYGVKAILAEYHIDEFPYNGTYCNKVINLGISGDTINLLNHIEKYGVKPYLRPMSGMTEDEMKEYLAECDKDDGDSITTPRYHGVEWLIKNKFDYHGLIPIGLALEAPEGMYN